MSNWDKIRCPIYLGTFLSGALGGYFAGRIIGNAIGSKKKSKPERLLDSSNTDTIIVAKKYTSVDKEKLKEMKPVLNSPVPQSSGQIQSSPFPKPVGLKNFSRTCYFNSALQCFSRLYPLTKLILSDDFPKMINSDPNGKWGTHGKVANAYREFLQQLSNAKTLFVPRKFKDVIGQCNPDFSSDQVEMDSQEFLSYLLTTLEEDTLSNPNSFPDQHQSPIGNLVQGHFSTTLTCPHCGHTRQVQAPEKFEILSLPIPQILKPSPNNQNNNSKKQEFLPVSLKDCLNDYMKGEVITDQKMECSNCHSHVNVTKTNNIENTSDILIVQLKRFRPIGYNNLGQPIHEKVKTPVSYPDVLESKDFTKDPQPKTYKLVGAVFHHGKGNDEGHYTAAALDPISNQWYHFNDSILTKINQNDAHNPQEAYMLFYQKQ